MKRLTVTLDLSEQCIRFAPVTDIHDEVGLDARSKKHFTLEVHDLNGRNTRKQRFKSFSRSKFGIFHQFWYFHHTVKIAILVKIVKTFGEERGFFVRLPHPEVGRQTHTGIPWLLSNAPNGVRAPAPVLGQHTDEVMRDILGYADAEIARLREDRILF